MTARKQAQPALFQIEKPAADLVPLPQTANHLIGEWLRHCPNGRPPKKVIGHVSMLIKEMLDEGVPYVWIRRGLIAWQDKGMHPAALPAEVNIVMNSAPRVERTQRAAEAWGRVARRIVDGH